ncbi:TetR/AcrR family transcriptional regulator [Nocardia sp. GCM10030253]|uniref:TetR/AcrR family transcriptional regulator n=1 Tax=Nocardia sp. GCM10030253 TaxID=3273404 RepID=UPI00364362B1
MTNRPTRTHSTQARRIPTVSPKSVQSGRQPDWLAGGDRHALAVERIHAAAAELIARNGMAGLNIDHVAAHAGCSRATVYRYVGGKSALREAVLTAATNRIAATIQRSVATLTGPDRIARAILAALDAVRADPVAVAFLAATTPQEVGTYLAGNPRLADTATALTATTDDPATGQWIVRVVLSLLFWPASDPTSERTLVDRFVVPAFTP